MFASTYEAVKETADANYRFQSALLQFEFSHMESLPAPLNLVSLALSTAIAVIKGAAHGLLVVLRICCFCCCKRLKEPRTLHAQRPVMSDAWKTVLKVVKKMLDAEKAADDDDDDAVVKAFKLELLKVTTHLNELQNDVKSLSKLVTKPIANHLKWVNVGANRPVEGRELFYPKLASALKNSTEFTEEEWTAFGITDVRYGDYILSSGEYFQPEEAKSTAAVAKDDDAEDDDDTKSASDESDVSEI